MPTDRPVDRLIERLRAAATCDEICEDCDAIRSAVALLRAGRGMHVYATASGELCGLCGLPVSKHATLCPVRAYDAAERGIE